MIGVLLSILMYLTPIFYPKEIVARSTCRWVVRFNPMRSILEVFRDPIYHGKIPPLTPPQRLDRHRRDRPRARRLGLPPQQRPHPVLHLRKPPPCPSHPSRPQHPPGGSLPLLPPGQAADPFAQGVRHPLHARLALLREALGAARRRPDHAARRDGGHHRPQRRRQEHDAQGDLRVLKPTAGTAGSTAGSRPILELGSGFDYELTGLENIYLNALLLGHSATGDRREDRRRSSTSAAWGTSSARRCATTPPACMRASASRSPPPGCPTS